MHKYDCALISDNIITMKFASLSNEAIKNKHKVEFTYLKYTVENREQQTARRNDEELETYRRAERIEREAKERADLVYFQANGVLSEATAKVDELSSDITDLADQVMRQLTQLQVAVSSSKQALQDASSIMSTIRPNK